MNKLLFTLALLIFFCCSDLAAQSLLPRARSGTQTWGDWRFSWNVGNQSEGLEISDVHFKNIKVIHKASMPVIRVKYRGNGNSLSSGCGPYLDRINWGNIELISGATTKVFARILNDSVLELAIYAKIGGYNIYQAWEFHRSGRLQPMLYSSGWGACPRYDPFESGGNLSHKHHPYWRIDFDVETTSNEVFELRTANGVNGQTTSRRLTTEVNSARLPTNSSIAWTINRPGSSKHVLIRYPGNEFSDLPGRLWFGFSNKDAALRRYNSAEDRGWPWPGRAAVIDPHFGWNNHLPFMSPSEATNNQDVVFWAVGHLFHQWSPSDFRTPHWHSTGPIIDLVNF